MKHQINHFSSPDRNLHIKAAFRLYLGLCDHLRNIQALVPFDLTGDFLFLFIVNCDSDRLIPAADSADFFVPKCFLLINEKIRSVLTAGQFFRPDLKPFDLLVTACCIDDQLSRRLNFLRHGKAYRYSFSPLMCCSAVEHAHIIPRHYLPWNLLFFQICFHAIALRPRSL